MDRSIPPAAAKLLSFIYKTETGRDAPACYDVIYGHNQDELPKPLTAMTLNEVEAAQSGWSKRFGSSAAGAAQFMKNTLDAANTLRDIEGEMGLTGSELFSPDLQDRMAFHLLKRRGYNEFMAGELSATEFGKRLAMEWASFPVLATTKGAKRQLKRGQSYYAGDGLNRALTKPETVEAVLDEVQQLAAGSGYDPVPSQPSGAAPNWWPALVVGGLAALVFAWQWFTGGHAPVAHAFPDGAPVPMDRPMKLVGGPGAGLAMDIGLQILLAFIGPLISAAATVMVGWVVYWWQRVLKTDFDKKSADQLHAALERGILAAVEALGAKAPRSQLLAGAADYAEQWNGGTVKRLRLTRSDLEELAVPHLAKLKKPE